MHPCVHSLLLLPIHQILQYVIIPTFSSCFEEGKVDTLLGGPPDPERDSDDNIISVFIKPRQTFGLLSEYYDDHVTAGEVWLLPSCPPGSNVHPPPATFLTLGGTCSTTHP